ncbi:NUDIX domain protein [Mycobacterium xenopi 4042]|uniref:NUDIX domain protein n=1 Tax=Mycobacterium xenopi 4042 TaxID=1299334 RepID=X8DJW6_MYCXE|nr:NUDIX domain protein [Mycobacterium xenopi 4042]
MGDLRQRRPLLGSLRCGRFAAARAAPDGTPAVLLQHRAWWSHQGGTWGLPGGARDSHETPEQTAVREACEEAGLPTERLAVRGVVVTAEVFGARGAHWTYTTVVADAGELLTAVPNGESAELRWVAEDEVADLPLHPGFAASWQRLRTARPPCRCMPPTNGAYGCRARWRSRPGCSSGACPARRIRRPRS